MSFMSQNDISDFSITPSKNSSDSDGNEEMISETTLGALNHPDNLSKNAQINECPGEKYERDVLNKIARILSEVRDVEQEAMNLSEIELKDKYQKFEEILIQKTISLDNIDTKSMAKIRETRKKTIVYIQRCLQVIDDKIKNQ